MRLSGLLYEESLELKTTWVIVFQYIFNILGIINKNKFYIQFNLCGIKSFPIFLPKNDPLLKPDIIPSEADRYLM